MRLYIVEQLPNETLSPGLVKCAVFHRGDKFFAVPVRYELCAWQTINICNVAKVSRALRRFSLLWMKAESISKVADNLCNACKINFEQLLCGGILPSEMGQT